MGSPTENDQTERLIRLEEKHQSNYRLTRQIADNADTTAKALQELVLIHKETQLRSETDRININSLDTAITSLRNKHAKLYKYVWWYIYTGSGIATVLGVLWYSGLLSKLINVHNTIPTV
jgi:protoporphyrinogen oxidase